MLKNIIQEYYDRMYLCEGQKWDLEHEVRKRDYEVLTDLYHCEYHAHRYRNKRARVTARVGTLIVLHKHPVVV